MTYPWPHTCSRPSPMHQPTHQPTTFMDGNVKLTLIWDVPHDRWGESDLHGHLWLSLVGHHNTGLLNAQFDVKLLFRVLHGQIVFKNSTSQKCYGTRSSSFEYYAGREYPIQWKTDCATQQQRLIVVIDRAKFKKKKKKVKIGHWKDIIAKSHLVFKTHPWSLTKRQCYLAHDIVLLLLKLQPKVVKLN